jgi:hypothetical protein
MVADVPESTIERHDVSHPSLGVETAAAVLCRHAERITRRRD